jgi:hypothetical protein
MHLRTYIMSMLAALSPMVQSQNYFPLRNDGNLPKGYVLDKIYESGKNVLLSQPDNNQLSVPAQIPFDFYFYNTPYSSYKVSDNGYLTFDLGQNVSLKPDSVLPRNSISAFWQDFKLQQLPTPNEGIGIQVFSYTVGNAPNRQHIIQYYGLTLATDPLDKPVTNASLYAFAIILHEGSAGRFDVVYSPYGDKSVKGRVGCSNADGSMYKLLGDSAVNLPFQFSFDLDKFIVYKFVRGTQPEYDLVIKDLNLGKIYPVNSIVNFSGQLSNWGKRPVSSFYMNYSINQGDTISYLVDGLDLKPDGEGNVSFLHPISWLSGAVGSLSDVNFWLSKPNGLPDGMDANSHITRKVLRNNNNYTAIKNVLFEEATGAWCGYCPDAHLLLKQAIKQHGRRIVPVSYHIEDSMSNSDGNVILSNYVTSYPDAILDRKTFLGSNSTWLAEVNARLSGMAPVDIFIEERNYNLQTREITYRVRVKFSDYWYGNLRLGSIVTENNVRGGPSPNIWSQYNYYSKDHSGGVGGSTHPLYNEKEYMDGYIHQFVNRAMPGGVWGVEGLMPFLVAPGSEYSMDFKYVLPEATFVHYDADNNTEYCSTVDIPGQDEGWNIPANINLIGYVAEYNDTDAMHRPIINSGQKRLWDLENGIRVPDRQAAISVFPNPSSDRLNIGIDLEEFSDVSIIICNSFGQVVCEESFDGLSRGRNVLFVNSSSFTSGIYQVHVFAGSVSYVASLSVAR